MPAITQTYVKRAKTRAAKYEVACTRVKGLVLRVLPSGKKVYYFRGRVDGKDRRVRLGKTNEISLVAARARAQALAQGEAAVDGGARWQYTTRTGEHVRSREQARGVVGRRSKRSGDAGDEERTQRLGTGGFGLCEGPPARIPAEVWGVEERTQRLSTGGFGLCEGPPIRIQPAEVSGSNTGGFGLCEGPPVRIQSVEVWGADGKDVADPTRRFAVAGCTDIREVAIANPQQVEAYGRVERGEWRRAQGQARRRAQVNQGTEQVQTITIREMATIIARDHVEVVLKPATRGNYRRALREINRKFGTRDLLEVTQREVIRWHRSMAQTKSAANFKVRTLNLLYKKAQEWEYLPWERRLPTQGIKYFRESLVERFLTPAERERLESALQEGLEKKGNQKGSLTWFNVAAIRLLSLTGMRRGEVLGLKWSYIDRVNRIVTLPESKTGRSVRPISAFTVEYLNQLEKMHRKPGCEYVIYGRSGSQLHARALHSMWVRLRKTIGLEDVRIHDLRHSAASDALNAGVPLAVVGAILGHKSPQTTARYAHVASTVARDATDRMTAGMARIVRGVGG